MLRRVVLCRIVLCLVVLCRVVFRLILSCLCLLRSCSILPLNNTHTNQLFTLSGMAMAKLVPTVFITTNENGTITIAWGFMLWFLITGLTPTLTLTLTLILTLTLLP